MNEAMAPLPKDHPEFVAWEKFKGSPEYANSMNWLRQGNYEGEVWGAFDKGWNAANNHLKTESSVESETESANKTKLSPELLHEIGAALGGAYNALSSYKYGNSSPDLAAEICDQLEAVIKKINDPKS